MSGLGKILKKIDPTVAGYERDNIKYEKLSQDPHDNEAEDDDVAFAQDGATTNGRHEVGAHAAINGVNLQKAKILKRGSDLEVKVKKLRILTRYRLLCLLCVLLSLVAAGLAAALLWPVLSGKKVTVMHFQSTPNWTLVMENTVSESCLRLFDVDSDGRDDVILGVVDADRQMEAMDVTREGMEKYCISKGETVPCLGSIKAIRGYDGVILWTIQTYGTVFEINCGHIDVNKDGHMDCIGTGRLGTSIAFDPRNGTVLWDEDLAVTGEGWNTYQVLVLPDLTDDGVPEVLLPNGGDPKFEPEEHVRYAGRLILLDGATGKHIGRALKMYDDQGEKETYMSPVMHKTKDGSMYILYGSGGETVRGSFYVISVPDYFRYVMSLEGNAPVPKTLKGKYQDFPNIYRNKDGIMAIYNSSTKGVMVPPVCVDMNGDGVKDILMSAYDGAFILYDGQTLQLMWSRIFPYYEMYSTPAPGYFNDDNVLDFMFHINMGTWDAGYNYSQLIVLDGSNGAKLLDINTTFYEMSSDLVAMTTERNRDLFITRIQRNVTHSDLKRTKRQLFNSPFQRRHSQNLNSRYGDERANQYGYEGQGDAISRYDYNPHPYNRYDQQTYDPSISLRRNSLLHSGDNTYPGNAGYFHGNQEDYDGYETADVPRPYGSGANGDPKSFSYDSHSMPDISAYDSQEEERPFFAEHPRVFHPDPQEEIVLDGNKRCDKENLPTRITEFYAIDRTSVLRPLRLFASPPATVFYNLSAIDREDLRKQNEYREAIDEDYTGLGVGPDGRPRRHGQPGEAQGQHHDLSQANVLLKLTNDDELCTVTTATEKTTGAIGDLDGDGDLDLVLIIEQEGQKHDKYGSDFKPMGRVSVMKVDLKVALREAEEVDLHPTVAPGVEVKEKVKVRDLKFKAKEEQLWAAYLGSSGDSVYGKS